MSWGFEPGRVYNRRRDIHDRFGGEGGRQSGIITFATQGLVVIVSGQSGLAHGYADRWRDDGVFEYFGQGQVGDMQMIRGNAAIAEHSGAGKSLLLFEEAPGGLRFVDEMVYERHHIERKPDRLDGLRDAIVFELRRLGSVVESVEEGAPSEPQPDDLSSARRRAIVAASAGTSGTITTRTAYQRSQDVRYYVLLRANGLCEGCGAPAPFKRTDGSPYLEPHHTLRVSDGGPDHPAHVIALCPNCHRRVHAGADGPAYNNDLIVVLGKIEKR
ncbi:MAG: HNH endonuclease [Rhizobiaceae bacterium]|nr:MAG: HNH endonuclease [Rhizobiaceae bacterium]